MAVSLVVLGSLFIGAAMASHKTHQVPIPAGVSTWDMCAVTKESVEKSYYGCSDMVDAYTERAGQGMPEQCQAIRMMNECMMFNVSLPCPDIYRQYRRDMAKVLPSILLFCGGPMGLVSNEEYEHLVWIEYEKMYWAYMEKTMTTEEPEIGNADEATVNIDRNMTTVLMETDNENETTVDVNNTMTTATTEIDNGNGTWVSINSTEVVEEEQELEKEEAEGGIEEEIEEESSGDIEDGGMTTRALIDDAIRKITTGIPSVTTIAGKTSRILEAITTIASVSEGTGAD